MALFLPRWTTRKTPPNPCNCSKTEQFIIPQNRISLKQFLLIKWEIKSVSEWRAMCPVKSRQKDRDVPCGSMSTACTVAKNPREYDANAGNLTITPFSSLSTYVTIGWKHFDVSCSCRLKVDFMILLGAPDGSCLICLKRKWRNEHDYSRRFQKRNYH